MEQKKYFVHDIELDEPVYSSATLEDCLRIIDGDKNYQVKMMYQNTITVYDEKGNEIKKYRI